MNMFTKVLVANRGEIACRIIKTLQEMRIDAVAVYSEWDKNAPHVALADEAFPLDGQTAAETYLNSAKLVAVAKQAGAEAIHPGYGFLSENAPFAQACIDAGLVFIGPGPKVISAMGDKIIAKKTMTAAGVPVVPGWEGDPSDKKALEKAAHAVGYPILVKAAAGGGGKGMRLVAKPDELAAAVDSAAREAQKAFGDPRVFLEKYIEKPRHIEFQIFGDHHGNVVHLFERECSIQRRHQKIIEESPSPMMTPALREKMGQAAIEAARAMGYTNAGTVEFIVDPHQNFYFLEVNTRLQVEHPVTEWVTQEDLVRTQLLIAMGEPLPFANPQQNGHAVECRIYAEDPDNHFFPSSGTLHVYEEPAGPGIRVDGGVRQGDTVSVHYDPMLSKLSTWGKTRDEAIARMQWALAHYPVLGVTTNIGFLQAVMHDQRFQSGEIDTHFLDSFSPAPVAENPLALAIAAIASQKPARPITAGSGSAPAQSPWQLAGAWRQV